MESGLGAGPLVLFVLLAVYPLSLSAQGISEGGDSDVVQIEFVEVYYTLQDTTLTEVIARLNRTRLAGAGGEMSQGLTEYYIQPSWRPLVVGRRCRVSHLTLRVQIRVTLPTWPSETDRPPEERASWQTIEGAIRSHEHQHRDLTINAARALADDLNALETPGCRALRQAFSGKVALAGERLDEIHAQFDRDTPERLSIAVKLPGEA